LLTEALKLNPWSTVARNGMKLVAKLTKRSNDEGLG
jgi:hypothetical protein